MAQIKPEKKWIPLDTLHLNMAAVFSELADICCSAENALGEILERPSSASDQSLIALQGLDRLRQSLEDMSRLTIFLPDTVSELSGIEISTSHLQKQIVLAGLLCRLTDKEPIEVTVTEEIWG